MIEDFLNSKKLTYKITDTHYQLDCFLCSDTRARLGIDKKTSKWFCFNCNSKGNKLSTLEYAYKHKSNIIQPVEDNITPPVKSKINPNAHIKYFNSIKKTKSNNVVKYLKSRNISIEAIKHFKLGHRSIFLNKEREKYDAGEHLVIPYLVNNKCVNLKYRALDTNVDKKYKWRREKGGLSVLYNNDVINNLEYKNIIINESEVDCISLWSLGIKNVIGLTIGASGFKQEWYDKLLRFEKIYLVLDNDIPGQEGAKKLAKRLGTHRCYNVVLPEDVKDPNDFILKYDITRFNSLIKKASRFEVADSISLRSVMNDIYRKRFIDENDEVKGFKTQWPKINKILGSLKPGYLVIISGKPKTGKSSASLNLMEYWGSQNIVTGMYSCEMRVDRIGEKLTQMVVPNVPKPEDMSPLDIREAQIKLPIDYMHFFYPQPGDLELSKVCEKIEEMVQRYGIKIFFFDNLHFLCRGENEKAMVDMATQAFKLLAESLDIVFVLISHPRKTNHNKQLKTDDLKGSGSIFQDADLVWLMHRPFNDSDMTPDEVKSGSSDGAMSPRTEISITGRWTDGGRTYLAFNGERSLFKDYGDLYNKITKEFSKKKRRVRRE